MITEETRRLAPHLSACADMEALLDDSEDVLLEHTPDAGDDIALAVGGGLCIA